MPTYCVLDSKKQRLLYFRSLQQRRKAGATPMRAVSLQDASQLFGRYAPSSPPALIPAHSRAACLLAPACLLPPCLLPVCLFALPVALGRRSFGFRAM